MSALRVLFVLRSASSEPKRPAEESYARFLRQQGTEVDVFYLFGSAKTAYTRGAQQLRAHLKSQHYDLVHGFYSYSSIIAALVSPCPVVCSLIGSDLMQASGFMRRVVRFYQRYVWRATFVMSRQMQRRAPNSIILPTGVDFERFYPEDRTHARERVGFASDRIHIILITTAVERWVKNIPLARAAAALLPQDRYELHLLSGIPNTELVHYYSAADLLLMTSYSEGSPNVVKEALACNCPVLSTDVGDVAERITGLQYSRITPSDPKAVADNILEITRNSGRENSRDVIAPALDWNVIVRETLEYYKRVLQGERVTTELKP